MYTEWGIFIYFVFEFLISIISLSKGQIISQKYNAVVLLYMFKIETHGYHH